MNAAQVDTYQKIFPTCRRILGRRNWGRILKTLGDNLDPQVFPDRLSSWKQPLKLPAFIVDLARVEWTRHQLKKDGAPIYKKSDTMMVNPSLVLVPVSFKNLIPLINKSPAESSLPESSVGCHVIFWRHPKTGRLHLRESEDVDLLALKIAVENIDPRDAAFAGGVSVGAIESALNRAVSKGLLLRPESLIRRDPPTAGKNSDVFEPFLTAQIFTLQWHITQACDLYCKHCYDRSPRSSLPFDSAVAILDDFYGFCREMHVKGQVNFTGGNPLLYPHFKEIYQEASMRGFGTAILGNPSPLASIQTLLDIARPLYFQISLEGLEAHNDSIRGKGHFQRSLAFLDQLRSLKIYTMVMLTLSRDNIEQVIPLADLLRDRTDFFTFNRLATVGEGAQLSMATPETFEVFLRHYESAARKNPMLGLKDNLINILRWEKGMEPFGGCAGYGCGAAFNFVALLPDGEVHACRKFPSPMGNVLKNRLMDIYHSPIARQYRNGSTACRDCILNIVCRGCLAITYSHGQNVFTAKDPFCFMEQAKSGRALSVES